jgi:hypothetical protein
MGSHLFAAARLVVLTAVVVGAFVFAVGPASANHVSCGDTIVADTTLDSDLVNCPNNGVVVGAEDITLDLNGHRIDGDGTPAAGAAPAGSSATSGCSTTATMASPCETDRCANS